MTNDTHILAWLAGATACRNTRGYDLPIAACGLYLNGSQHTPEALRAAFEQTTEAANVRTSKTTGAKKP